MDTFGGNITRVGRRNDIEISFEGIPVSVQDFDAQFQGYTTNTATSLTTSAETKQRVTILWTSDPAVTSAVQACATSSTNEAYRHVYADAYMTSLEYSMAAGENLKAANITFKLPYTDDTDKLNFVKAIQDTSASLSAVPAYTSSTTKFA
jgi:hypothetical protein